MLESIVDKINVHLLRAGVSKGRQFPTASFVDDGFCILELHTDSGIIGLGEPSPYGDIRKTYRFLVDEVEARVKGKTLAAAWDFIKSGFFIKELYQYAAIAGLSHAILDAMGKERGVPAWCVLSGKAQPFVDKAIPAYASGGMLYNHQPLELLVDEVLSVKDRGFSAWKFRPPIPTNMSHIQRSRKPPEINRDSLVKIAQKIRYAVGDEFVLMIDLGCRCSTVEEAVWICEALSELDFYLIEEPLPRYAKSYAKLRERCSNVKIAGGETLVTLEQFREWLSEGSLDIVQPDANLIGMNDGYRLGQYIKSSQVELIPHNWANGISAAANIQLAASLGGEVPFIESSIVFNPLREKILKSGLNFENGRYYIREFSGLGVSLNKDVVDEYRLL